MSGEGQVGPGRLRLRLMLRLRLRHLLLLLRKMQRTVIAGSPRKMRVHSPH